jgi:hypothetical protein
LAADQEVRGLKPPDWFEAPEIRVCSHAARALQRILVGERPATGGKEDFHRF